MDDASHRLDDPTATAGLLALASPGDEARALALDPEGQPPRALLDRLASGGHFPDAVKLLALAMPRRDAVWWACRCCRESPLPDEPGPAVAALEAAERWAADPTEPNRRAAHAAAEAAGMEAPAACAAMGAFFSGGSIAPPNVPDVPPAPHLAAHMVAGAVMLSAVLEQPERAPEKYRAFLGLGLAVADGIDRPPSAAVPTPEPTRAAPLRDRGDRWGSDSNRPPVPAPPARSTAPTPPQPRRWDEWE